MELRNSSKICPTSVDSDLEHFLLLAGLFSVPHENLHRLCICSSHYHYLIKARRKNNCDLCQILRKKGTSCQNFASLRQSSKNCAVALWIARQCTLYQYWTCTECRRYVAERYVNDETTKIANEMFLRLYDNLDQLVITPVPSPMSSPNSDYAPSFDDFPLDENVDIVRRFEHLLREQDFEGRIETTSAYQSMNKKSRRTFRKQTKDILLHVIKMLAQNDCDGIWQEIVCDVSDVYEHDDSK